MESIAHASMTPMAMLSKESRSDSPTGILRKNRHTKAKAKKHISLLESDGKVDNGISLFS